MASVCPQLAWTAKDASPLLQFSCLHPDKCLQNHGFDYQEDATAYQSSDGLLWSLLLLGPSLILLATAPFRIFRLSGAEVVVLPNKRGLAKAVSSSYRHRVVQLLTNLQALAAILFAWQLVYFMLSIQRTATTIWSAAIRLVAYGTLPLISILEHGRSVRPSTLLTLFLVFSASSDAIQWGLLHFVTNCPTSPAVIGIAFTIKVILLVLEMRNKMSILREPYENMSPEEISGLLGNLFFWWVNDFIVLGYSKILSADDMPPLPSYLNSMKLRKAMQVTWDQRSMCLIRVLVDRLLTPTLSLS